ncbi:MAG: oligoendopeptidase F [Clostridiaceae bacterium]
MSDTLKVKTREEIEDKYKWKVGKIYQNDDLWEKDYEKLKAKAPSLLEYKGKLDDKKNLLKFLELRENILRLNEKLFVYAHLRNDENTQNPKYQGVRNKISSLSSEVASYISYFMPEIIDLSDEKYNEIIRDKEFLEYKFLFQDIRNLKEHTLSKDKEEIISALSDSLEAPSDIFNMLTFADMKFGIIKDENGNDTELTSSNYSIWLKSENRAVREAAFKLMHNTFKKYENTYAAMLTSSVKTFALNSKLRSYKSSIEASLKPNNIPVSVFDNTIEAVNDNIEVLHKYVKLKKKLLGLSELHMYDLYTPVIKTPKFDIPYEKGVEIIKKALKPLGKEYLDIFEYGIKSGWVDVYENQGKKGGAYSSGCYDTEPFVLLNYNNDVNSVSTLAHEMGHSIHTYYSNKTQPYQYAEYTLFCAEVASTTNENLLINYLIDNEKDKNMRLYLINQELENIRTTLFRQVMFAEFEKFSHESIEAGIPLTAEEMNKFYYDLNKKYFGDDIVVDKEIEIEWARIPHFYRDFYVYQYATGYSAAFTFAKRILNKEEGALRDYFNFLKSGGSDYPINILKNSKVDMTVKEPILNTIKRFDDLINMLS